MCREIELGLSRKHNIGYIEGNILRISREANDWHKERHLYGLDIKRQGVLNRGEVLQKLKDNPHKNIMRVCKFDKEWVWVEYINGVVFDNRSQWTPKTDQEKDCYLMSHLNRLGCGNRTKVLQGIIDGVQHLHKIGIAHTDLTGFNVMVNEKHEAKIIDLLGAMPLTKKLQKLDDRLVLRIFEASLTEPLMNIKEYRVWEKTAKNIGIR